MAETAVPEQRTRAQPAGRAGRVREYLRRARGSDGHERHTLAFIGKATLAASASWFVAQDVMAAQSPAFAPFSALLIIQVTAYRSIREGLRYIVAVAAGVALQGALGLLTGSGVATFALVALLGLAVGQWRKLGTQGSQVATVSFFTFSTYVSADSTSQQVSQIGQILVLILVGCGVGMVVNILVVPPMRYRSAEHGVQVLARSLCDVLGEVHRGLRQGTLDERRTGRWRHRAARLDPIVGQAHASLRTSWESTFFNLHHVLRRRRGRTTFSGYQKVIEALERVTHQVGSMTRSLDQWHGAERESPQHREFLSGFGDFLGSLTRVTGLMSRIDEDRLTRQYIDLCAFTEEAQQHRDRLAHHAAGAGLPVADPAQPYGILLAEATRLMDEFQYTCEVIHQVIDGSNSPQAAT